MTQEPLTLYKLIVLYMLNKVTFPLTKAQVNNFILEREYTNFLTLQQAIADLIDTGLVHAKTIRNRTHLVLTKEGSDTLSYFEDRISDAIKEDINAYFKEEALELRNEVSVFGDYYKSVSGDYEASLTAKDKNTSLVTITLSVPTEEMASKICEHWQDRHLEIYQYLTGKLF